MKSKNPRAVLKGFTYIGVDTVVIIIFVVILKHTREKIYKPGFIVSFVVLFLGDFTKSIQSFSRIAIFNINFLWCCSR